MIRRVALLALAVCQTAEAWTASAWSTLRHSEPVSTTLCACATSIVLTNYSGTNAVVSTNAFLNDITAPPCSTNAYINTWTYRLIGPTGQTITATYTITNVQSSMTMQLNTRDIKALESYLALYERWIASGETPVPGGPNTSPYRAPRYYRNNREALVEWKECASRMLPLYVDRTGIETQSNHLPYVRTLSAVYVAEWLNIPTNYFTQTAGRQLDGIGLAMTSSWCQSGFSDLDYGWKYVTNIIPLMTWTKSQPQAQRTEYPESNNWWNISSFLDYPTYEQAQQGAKIGLEDSLGYGRNAGNPVFWAQAIYTPGAQRPYSSPAQAWAIRAHFRGVTTRSLECMSSLYVAATNHRFPPSPFYDAGFNLSNSTPSLIESRIKPIGTNAVTVFFDPTRGRGLESADGHWPPDPATVAPSENGSSYSSHGFAVTNWWVIHKWDATTNGFRFK